MNRAEIVVATSLLATLDKCDNFIHRYQKNLEELTIERDKCLSMLKELNVDPYAEIDDSEKLPIYPDLEFKETLEAGELFCSDNSNILKFPIQSPALELAGYDASD